LSLGGGRAGDADRLMLSSPKHSGAVRRKPTQLAAAGLDALEFGLLLHVTSSSIDCLPTRLI
jgi:hypothetical protein